MAHTIETEPVSVTTYNPGNKGVVGLQLTGRTEEVQSDTANIHSYMTAVLSKEQARELVKLLVEYW